MINFFSSFRVLAYKEHSSCCKWCSCNGLAELSWLWWLEACVLYFMMVDVVEVTVLGDYFVCVGALRKTHTQREDDSSS